MCQTSHFKDTLVDGQSQSWIPSLRGTFSRHILHGQSSLAIKHSQFPPCTSSLVAKNLLHLLRSWDEACLERFGPHILALGEGIDADVEFEFIALCRKAWLVHS
jgi:hypothetical protein